MRKEGRVSIGEFLPDRCLTLFFLQVLIVEESANASVESIARCDEEWGATTLLPSGHVSLALAGASPASADES